MSKYIEINLYAKGKKTNIYDVCNKKTGLPLGAVQWHPAWRQYCYYPMEETVLNTDCMQYIIEFIKKLMEERKT